MKPNSIYSESKEELKSTQEFQTKLEKLKTEIKSDFDRKIKEESNFFKRQILKIQRKIQVEKAVKELSDKNLYNQQLLTINQ